MRTTYRDIWSAPPGTWLARAVMALLLAMVSVTAFSDPRPDAVGAGEGGLRFAGSFRPAGDDQIDHTFLVPPGTAHLEVELYCPSAGEVGTIEFGLRGPGGFRGWTMDGRLRISIDAISASAGYLPGAIEAGEWHLMLATAKREGLAADYQIAVRLSGQSQSPRPVLSRQPGWFAGDLHVHSAHSDGHHADGSGAQRPVLVSDLAARAAAAHHRFLAVTDHNTASHWLDIDRVQEAHSHLVLMHAREITTARGHLNAIGEKRYTDFRLGPARPMSDLLGGLASDGAFLSINHAWLASDHWCRGCGWLDRDPGTINLVHGVEVLNGSSPDPAGEMPGWRLWAEWLNRGARLVAIGGSDLHDPVNGQAAIGMPSTVVWAAALSEDAIVAGLKSGRVFIRSSPHANTMIDLTARRGATIAATGKLIAPGPLTLRARVNAAAGQQLVWIRRGQEIAAVGLANDDEDVAMEADAIADDWFSVIVRDGRQPTLISNAIYIR